MQFVQVLRIYGAALIMPGLPIGLVLWNLAGFWAPDGSEGLPTRFAWGAIAVVGAAIVGTLNLIGERRVGVGRGFGPRQSSTVPVRGGADLPLRVKVALLNLPAEIRETDVAAGRYAAHTGASWRGWGEHITVELTGDPVNPQARVTSRPRGRFVLYDYGQGRRTVDRVIEALQD
jgi:hypothetical protein